MAGTNMVITGLNPFKDDEADALMIRQQDCL
jgi:hypothetical protein